MAIEDESHILILGRPGSGKSTLVRLAMSERREIPALVVDYVGNYEDYVDYYAPYPINPLEFINPHDFIDALARVINTAYGISNAMSPAMEEVILTALENVEPASIPNALAWLNTDGTKVFRAMDEANALKGARRRLNVLLNNILFAKTTHPILRNWINGSIGQVGIRLRGVGLYPAIMYVTVLLTILARYEANPDSWRFIIIDEAQYFAQGDGITPLEEAVRVARNYKALFIAITQNIKAIPERLLDVFKIIIDFNQSSTPRRARIQAYPTSLKWASLANVNTPIEMPTYNDWVTVDPNTLDTIRRRSISWSRCLDECSVELSVRSQVVRGGIVRDLMDKSQCLWDCLAGKLIKANQLPQA